MYNEDGLCWSTFMGGGERDDVYESVEDENGNYYIVGTTGSTFMSFPEAPGTNYSSAGTVAYMMRFNTDDRVEWKTFFGGNAANEVTRGTGIGHKVDGEVYMAGYSDSEALSVYQNVNGLDFYQGTATGPSFKGFVCRLDKVLGEREWATYYGQNNVMINGMVGLGGKKIFIVGSTQSTTPDLDVSPPTNSTYWPYSSSADGFISMFGDNDQHAWRTHIPGTANDPVYDVDATGTRVVVMGNTHSEDLIIPALSTTPYVHGHFGAVGGEDRYLYEFTDVGAWQWSTYVGSSGSEQSTHNGVSIDPTTKDIALVGSGPLNLDVVQGPGWYQNTYPSSGSPGFIARFSGTDRSRTWHTYLHNGDGSVVYPTVCTFDPTGKLLVSAYVRDGDGSLLQALPGLYQQKEFNADVSGGNIEHKDPIVLAFGTSNQHFYGSLLAGEANPGYPEYIYALLHRRLNGNIYVGGVTSRANNVASYFPLDDGGGVPYFEALWHGGMNEGFLASICAEALNQVGIEEAHVTGVTLLSANWAEGRLAVFGLPAGSHRLQVVDAAGRVILNDAGRSDGMKLLTELPALAETTYLFRTTEHVARFVVIR